MRPRSSLVLAGALLVTLVPGTAMATQTHVSATASVASGFAMADDGLPSLPDPDAVLTDTVLVEDALTDVVGADSSDALDLSTLVPQDGAVVDDVDGHLDQTGDPG